MTGGEVAYSPEQIKELREESGYRINKSWRKKEEICARYVIVRGDVALWKGDAAEAGSPFRQFVITSNEFNSTLGIFQAYGIEGIGKGVKDGALIVSEEDPKVLFDADFNGIDGASKKIKELVEGSQKQGFKIVTMMDHCEFLDELRKSRKA
jgi:hypothetical protein